MNDRVILHSDANCFYASVEMLLNPELQDKAVAVCGSEDDRHGIVLAKSEKAKRMGVKTGQANWEARQACPGLICVPPHYEQYNRFSMLLRNIYRRYTDLIEPYGMDECWLDVTGSDKIHGNGTQIAEDIRQTVKDELGITVSIGVSFSKILAKLGSDMKKPDAITVLDSEHWRESVWRLPVSDLLFVGPRTAKKLMERNVLTIGDLARTDLLHLRSWFGKNGIDLWIKDTINEIMQFANQVTESGAILLTMHYMQHRSKREIARLMHVSHSCINRRLLKLLTQLRENKELFF